MAQYVVEGTSSAGFIPAATTTAVELIAELSHGQLGGKDQVEVEVDLMMGQIREFAAQEPDEVMQACSAISARCTELCILLHRVEGAKREYRQIRTQQVQRVLDEIDRQFKLHSRMVELRRQDIDVLRGAGS